MCRLRAKEGEKMEVETNQLEAQVRTALTAVKIADTPDDTREVKNAIGRVVKEHGFKWAANGCDVADDSREFMWDGSAWDEDKEGWTMHHPLILESEWGSKGHVRDDFLKLPVGRAQLRVMVFQAKDEREAVEISDWLETGSKKSGISEPGDRYLLACWVRDAKKFTFRGLQV